MQKTYDISAERIRELLDYNPCTGVCRWRRAPSNLARVKIGVPITSQDSYGHIQVKINGRSRLLHRLIWLYQTGTWPGAEIDHINGVRNDNRWVNLREANRNSNMHNERRAHSRTSSGELGVQPSKTPGKWMANIRLNTKPIRLGTYPTKVAALSAYLNAKCLAHPESPLVQGLVVDYSAFNKAALKSLKAADLL